MAFTRFKHRTGKVEYAFEGDEGRLSDSVSMYEKLPPNPRVVIASSGLMVEYTLDSIHDSYELDRQLNIEAEEEKGMKAYQESRKDY